MAELAGIAGRAVIQASVQDHAHAQAPAHIDKEDVLLLFHGPGEVFAVGHGAGVVLDHDGDVQVLGQDLVDGTVRVEGVEVAVAGLGIHAAGDADAHSEHAVPVQFPVDHEGADARGHLVQALFVQLQEERDVVLEGDEPALEVGDGDAGVRVAHVHADEVARLRIEAVDAGASSAGGPRLAHLDHETLLHELPDQFRDRGDAGIELLAQSRDAVFTAFDAQAEYGFLENGVFVVFFVQEGGSHLVLLLVRKYTLYF